MLCFLLFLITKTWKNKQLTIPLIQTHEESTGLVRVLVRVWNNRCLVTKPMCRNTTGLVRFFFRVSERPELFQTKIKINVLQDCAKDLGTSKSRTKGAKRYRWMVLFYIPLEAVEQKKALAKLRKKLWINPFRPYPQYFSNSWNTRGMVLYPKKIRVWVY